MALARNSKISPSERVRMKELTDTFRLTERNSSVVYPNTFFSFLHYNYFVIIFYEWN